MTEDWYGDDKATMGDRIGVAREQAGLSVEELAQNLGVRVETLNGWEADEHEPRANYLRTLSGVLGVSLVWLLTGQGPGIAVGPLNVDGREAALSEIRGLRQTMAAANRRLDRLEKMVSDA